MHMNKEIEEMMLTDHVKKIFEKIFFFFLGGRGFFFFHYQDLFYICLLG